MGLYRNIQIGIGLAVLGLGLGALPSAAQAALNIPLTVNMSEVVTVDTTGGTPSIAVDVGGNTRYATYTSGSGTNTLTFTLTPTVGDIDLDGITVSSPVNLNGATIKDAIGNNATLTFTPPNTSGIKVDYPSLSMDFINNDYILSGTHYATLPSFLTAAGGSFTRASTAMYFDSSGTLQTAASGSPRFDYDPITHVAKGLLIEESRTNSRPYSSDFSQAIWIKRNSTVNTDVITAPDGTLTADKIVDDTTASADHGISMTTVAVTAGTSWSTSIFAKAAEYHYLYLWLDNGAGNGMTFECDLSNGATRATRTSGSYSSVFFNATNVGNGWWRVTITGTTTLTSIQMRAYMSPTPWVAGNFGTPMYTGDGSSGVYLWGAQLEQGSFATSYIPTVAAAVTRAKDALQLPVGAWFNATSGTSYAKLSSRTSNTTYFPMAMDLNGNNYFIGTNGTISSTSKLANSFTLSAGGISSTARAKDGVSGLGSAGFLYASDYPVDTIWIGSNSFQSYLNSSLMGVKYYPATTSATQLQLLTQ